MAIVLDGTTGITTPDLESEGIVTSNGLTTSLYPLVSGTAVASTSGTSINFNSIPSWVKRITVMFSGVSTNGASAVIVQIGSGSFTASGYLSAGTSISSVVVTSLFTTGFACGQTVQLAAFLRNGIMTLTNLTGNTWSFNGVLAQSEAAQILTGAGSIALSGTLDRVRITTVNGTDTFDAGSINIMYE